MTQLEFDLWVEERVTERDIMERGYDLSRLLAQRWRGTEVYQLNSKDSPWPVTVVRYRV